MDAILKLDGVEKVLDVRSVYEGAWGEKYMPSSALTLPSGWPSTST